MAKPFRPSYASAHQPSSTERFKPPFKTTFWPLVPEASSGRRGLLSQTSTPCVKWRATVMVAACRVGEGMRLSGKHELHRTFRVIDHARYFFNVGQKEIGALVGGKAAGK